MAERRSAGASSGSGRSGKGSAARKGSTAGAKVVAFPYALPVCLGPNCQHRPDWETVRLSQGLSGCRIFLCGSQDPHRRKR